MTLREIILMRQSKYKAHKETTSEPYWKGYYEGWFWAYKDLLEILEQNGFDVDVVVGTAKGGRKAAEYIERDAILKVVRGLLQKTSNGAMRCSQILQMVSRIPAADVAEVVRCKDCELRLSSEFCECRSPDAFCSDGERRADDA